jgi:plasmid maintenance system antidote protein VapI
MVCKTSEIQITAFGLSPEKQPVGRKGKIMKTVVFNQGFNRVEHHQIICLERAKLNWLLDEERRITETLAGSVKRQIEAAPNLITDLQTAWNEIQNHLFLKAVRERINLLTDAYPQFLIQVETARQRLKKRIIDALDMTKHLARTATVCH